MATQPRQFRFSEEEIALMDALAKTLGLPSRVNVLRQALRRLADAEYGPGQNGPAPTPAPDQESKKKKKKS